jgi:cytidine deaminase
MKHPIVTQPTRPDAAFEDLIQAALAARARAYAPYSHFLVGAALLAEDGRVFTGTNVENATYGLTICAERTAVVKAVSEGVRQFKAIAIATDHDPPATPCGMCRQTLAEFALDLPIVLVNVAGRRVQVHLNTLLPHAFRPSDLLDRPASKSGGEP